MSPFPLFPQINQTNQANKSANTLQTVSQFTLLASTKKGNKPDFHGAAGGEEARRLYEHFVSRVRAGYTPATAAAAADDRVKDGVFQAMMEVALVNDGPVGCFPPPPFFPPTHTHHPQRFFTLSIYHIYALSSELWNRCMCRDPGLGMIS